MPQIINESLQFTEDFKTQLPVLLGDDYYNDPETKQQPTKIFENIKDVPTLLKKVANAERTISKGEAAYAEKFKGHIKVPGEGATPEEVAAYRKAIGVPETADGYKLTLPEGTSDADKATYESIAAEVKTAALEAGAPAGIVAPIFEKVVGKLNAQMAELERKGQSMMTADIELQKADLGDKYPQYVDDVSRTLAKIGGEKAAGQTETIGQQFQTILKTYGLLQFDDAGKLIGGNPAVMKALHEISPLVISGKPHVGADGGGGGDEKWFTNYDEVSGQNTSVDV